MTTNNDALIGYSGFVGSTLRRQRSFADLYRSTNIADIRGKKFDTVICAAAPAKKWIANKEPVADKQNLASLMEHLRHIQCSHFVLISTVDVFTVPVGVDEDTPVDTKGLHAYGLHRRELETFVQEHFSNHLIVRLPGLVGPGLSKNIIFDFLNDNNVDRIESRGVFQFYPMVNLWADLKIAMEASQKLVHFSSEPISVADVAQKGFGFPCTQHFAERVPGFYDMHSKHVSIFGAEGPYMYSQKETLTAIRAYAQSEPVTLMKS